MASQPVEHVPQTSYANREAAGPVQTRNNLNVHQLVARTAQKKANIQLC